MPLQSMFIYIYIIYNLESEVNEDLSISLCLSVQMTRRWVVDRTLYGQYQKGGQMTAAGTGTWRASQPAAARRSWYLCGDTQNTENARHARVCGTGSKYSTVPCLARSTGGY